MSEHRGERVANGRLSGVLLARHGETNDNLEPLRFQGFTDTPLNDTGRARQAPRGWPDAAGSRRTAGSRRCGPRI